MNIVSKLEEIYKRVDEYGYWRLVIPSDEDKNILICLTEYLKLSNNDKLTFRKYITYDLAGLLRYFSERMANLTLRSKEQEIFESGLYALDISCDRRDYREILMTLSLYYDVSIRNNLSFDRFINHKEAISETIKSFLNREEKDKTLKCMGYILTKDKNNNLIYQRTW